jgi:hypothetical protein
MCRDAHRGRSDRRLRLDASRGSIDINEHRHSSCGVDVDVDIDNDININDISACDLDTPLSADEAERISPRSRRHTPDAGAPGDAPAPPAARAEQRQHRRDPLITTRRRRRPDTLPDLDRRRPSWTGPSW